MKERPILFSAPMVRAILEGRKTQTRRVVKPPYKKHPLVNLREAENDERFSGRHDDPDSWGYQFVDDGAPAVLSMWPEFCPYGKSGDHLWVKETYSIGPGPNVPLLPHEDSGPLRWPHVTYEADGSVERRDTRWEGVYARKRSSIHMPRWASRITLEVTKVRVERLQAITEADAIAEGAAGGHGSIPGYAYATTPLEHYRHIWESINDAGSWETNPWVWVVEFKRLEGFAAQ